MSSPSDLSPRTSRFLTVAEAAALLKVSEVTIYRGIGAGEFPAVKIRGRYVIPAKAIDELEAAALAVPEQTLSATWTAAERRLAAGEAGFATPVAVLGFAAMLSVAWVLLHIPGVGVYLTAALGGAFAIGLLLAAARTERRLNAQLDASARRQQYQGDVEPPTNADWQAWS